MSHSQSHAHPQHLPPSLEKIIKGGRESNTPFPLILNQLNDWGITHYTVDLTKGEILHYDHKGQVYQELPSFTPLVVNDTLDAAAIKTAIQRRGPLRQTTYEEFCHEIAAAGVANYEVTTQSRKCTYRGKTAGQEYSEDIPVMKKS